MRMTLVPILALLCTTAASAQLLVPESTNDDVMMFDAFDGSLISLQFLDMNISTGAVPGIPQELIYAPNGDILISDQNGRVFRYSSDGSTYLGETTTPLSNVRGIESAYGSIWVANAGSTGGAPGESIVQLDLSLNLVQVFPLAFSPWDLQVERRGGVDGLLVTDLSGHNIQFFDPANPATTVMVHDSDGVTGINFPQYMRFRESNGNMLVAGFSPPSGVYEYDPATGNQLNYLNTSGLFGVGGLRSAHELGNGNLLISGPGVRVYDPVAGTLTTIVPTVAARAITKMPGSSVGTNYCTAVPNSTGIAASMSASGSAAVAANNLVLGADRLPLNAFGFFLTSATQGFVQNPGGSQGNLCLGSSIGRYVGPGQIQNSGAAGAIALPVDLTQHPTPIGPVPVQVGETWNFTAWYRDAVGGVAVSNFADGLEVVFN
jgi:hypothetical protein